MHDGELEAIRWDDLRFFLAVLRSGSFSKAGKQLGVDQSTVSRRIALLEARLGASLFLRHGPSSLTTELAEHLRPLAERAEAEVLGVFDLAAGSQSQIRGRVRLALAESMAVHVVIPHVLGDFASMYPGIEVDLVTSDYASDLARREADLALRFFRPEVGDLVSRKVVSLPTAVVAQRGYGSGRGALPSDYDWISLVIPGLRSAETEALQGLGVTARYRTNSYMAQVEMVRAGLGVAVVARALTRLMPELVEVQLGLENLPVAEVWLVAASSVRKIARVDALWRFLEKRLPELSDALQGE